PNRCAGPNATELPAGENPPTSISERNDASLVIRVQNRRKRDCAALRPPSTSPQASSTALTDPALAPLMASRSQSGSSKSRSRTPQVKAPNEPPPCKASDSFRGGQSGDADAGAYWRYEAAAPAAASLALGLVNFASGVTAGDFASVATAGDFASAATTDDFTSAATAGACASVATAG